jgi:hypothetical protein
MEDKCALATSEVLSSLPEDMQTQDVCDRLYLQAQAIDAQNFGKLSHNDLARAIVATAIQVRSNTERIEQLEKQQKGAPAQRGNLEINIFSKNNGSGLCDEQFTYMVTLTLFLWMVGTLGVIEVLNANNSQKQQLAPTQVKEVVEYESRTR